MTIEYGKTHEWLATNDVGLLRPWLDEYGKAWVTWKDGTKHQFHSEAGPVKEAVLTWRQWIELDLLAEQVFKQRTPFVQMLISHQPNSLAMDKVDGWAKMTLEDEPIPLKLGSTPVTFRLEALPLPITHCDWWVAKDRLAETSQNGWLMHQAAVRRVAEVVEGTFLGVREPLEADVPEVKQLFGVFDHPARMKLDAAGAFESSTSLRKRVERMIAEAARNKFFGPFVLLHGWKTVKEQLRDFNGVTKVVKVDHIKDRKMALVQLTPDVIQAVAAIKPVVVQWPTAEHVNERHEFKFLTCLVPRIRTDFHGTVGIVTLEE